MTLRRFWRGRMPKSFSSLLAGTILFTGFCIAAKPDVLNGGGGWQSWNVSTTLGTASSPIYSGQSGGPYWNNKSGDGPTMGIGWCLTGGGQCSISNPPGAIPFYGNGNAAVSDMWFSTGGSGVSITLRGIFTTQTSIPNGIDYFGYYLANSTGAPIAGTFHQLLSAGATPPASTSFVLPSATNYGFYLENVQGQGGAFQTNYYFFMDESSDMNNRGNAMESFQHFAIFNDTSSLYIGIEDGYINSDMDYNDMILQVSSTPVPEPSAPALAGLGLLAFGYLVLRRTMG